MSKFSHKSLMLLIISVYLFFILPQAGKLFMPEEIVFVKGAYAVVSTGLPVYAANVGNIEIALWHPPLYIYALALSFKLLGVTELSARLVSILFSLGTLAIVYLLAREVSDKDGVVLLSCFLFLLNPFTVQNSLLLDIDNTALTFLMSLFIYAYVRFNKREQYIYGLPVLGILFGATLWAKFGTPPVLIASMFIYHLAKKEYSTALYRSFIIGTSGVVLFLITWLTYSVSLGLPYKTPFEHNAAYLPASIGIEFLTAHLWGLKNIIFWITPFFAIISVIILLDMSGKKQFNIVDYLFINGALIFIEYVVIGSAQALDFPKYFAPMVPPLSVVLAGFIDKNGFEIKKNLKPVALSALLVSIYYIAVLKDPFVSDRIIFNSNSFYEIVRETALISFLYALPLSIPLLLLKKYYTFKNGLTLAALICLVSFSIHIGVVQSTAGYATNYLYGQEGYEEAVRYLQTFIKPDNVVITKTAIAYYTGVERWYALPQNSGDFINLTQRERIPYIVLPKEGYYTSRRYAGVMQSVEEKYVLKAQVGDFKIYQIKGN